jgi:receptor protein-tyrosine kinase
MSLIEKAFEHKKQQTSTTSNTVRVDVESVLVAPKPVKQATPARTSGKTRLTIDPQFLRRRGMITLDERRSSIKEQFRSIKRKILRNAFGAQSATLNHPNLVMITSCNPFEGKSFVASNLALSVAYEKDNTVLLADADVLRPNVCKTLGIEEPEVGLINRLLDEMDTISDALYPTNIERLSILPSGPRHHLSAELLQSQCMTALAEEMASRYSDRLVIFDSPPLLGVNETQILASLVGQVIVVVEEGKTTQKDLNNALSLLDPEKAIGCILNKGSRITQQDYGYGYASH